MSKKCIKCGAELEDGDMFCGQCGTSQPKTVLHCPNCGKELPEGSNFCIYCGTPVNNASDTMPTSSKKYPDCEVSNPDSDTICITIKGVRFNMKLVDGGIVDKYTELSDFYIGETVVTQELWQMVMGDNPSKDNRNLQLPVTGMSNAMCNAFLVRLRKITGCTFDFPTVFQWQYAYDGGKKSVKKTKYAGSDNVDEVAWVKSNSGKKLQPVAMLNPNVLGLYDMDGNVQEYCKGKLCKVSKYQFNPATSQDVKSFGISAISDKENIDFSGVRIVINVPVSESVLDFKVKDGDANVNMYDAPDAGSPLSNILLSRQKQQDKRLLAEIEEEKRQEAEDFARKQITHAMSITAIKDSKAAVLAAQTVLNWEAADARKKLGSLPVEVLISDKMTAIIHAYEKFKEAGVTTEVTTKNGLGEIIEGSFTKALEQKKIKTRKEAERKAKVEAERKAKEEAERKAKEEAKRKKAAEEYTCSGTTLSYTDNAVALTHLVKRLKESWHNKCRRGCITEGGSGVLINDHDICYKLTSPNYIKLKDALDKYGKNSDASVFDIALTNSGYRCMVFQKGPQEAVKWMGKVPSRMGKRLDTYIEGGETISSISIAENGDWAIITDKHFCSASSDSRVQKAMEKAESLYGWPLYIDLTDRGVICCCVKGGYYENIPSNVAEKIQKKVRNNKFVRFISFTDSGTYIMVDESGSAAYLM